jgi:hypothetical protein
MAISISTHKNKTRGKVNLNGLDSFHELFSFYFNKYNIENRTLSLSHIFLSSTHFTVTPQFLIADQTSSFSRSATRNHAPKHAVVVPSMCGRCCHLPSQPTS